MRQHTHNRDDDHLYDNGCILCDAQANILAYALDQDNPPPWVTEAGREAQAIDAICLLYGFHGITRPT